MKILKKSHGVAKSLIQQHKQLLQIHVATYYDNGTKQISQSKTSVK